MSLVPQVTLHSFSKWVINLVGPINPPIKMSGAGYIIIMAGYLTEWDEEELVKDCSVETIV
jgi:hypothetical protein